MSTQPRKDDDNIDALKVLWGGPGVPPSQPAASPGTPQTTPGAAAPAPRAAVRQPAPAPPNAAPLPEHYRCLGCGYRLAGAPTLRCPECGLDHDRDRLEAWFDGEEQRRFEMVLWLVVAGLFLRTCLLANCFLEILTLCRLGIAITVAWAGYHACKNKAGTIGGYYGMAAMLAGGLMFVLFSWSRVVIAFHTLDIIAAGLLIQAMTHDTSGGRVWIGGGRTLALALIFLAPFLGLLCYLAHNMWDAKWALYYPGMHSYPVFGRALPGLAALISWCASVHVLSNVRRTMFRAVE